MTFRCAPWLRNPHAQTVWGKFVRRVPKVATVAECLPTNDGDVIDVHHLEAPSDAPRLLILHGLEGTVESHYVGGMLAQAKDRGWGATLMLFRGCGPSENTARRFYHSGETTDVAHLFAHLRARWPQSSWCAAGVSLGGNVLLKWLGEQSSRVDPLLRAAVAVSVPFDLEAGARKISRGTARIYDRSFLRSLKRKALRKLDRYPDLFDRGRLMSARSVFDFDDAVTAPVHGFASGVDYYQRSSSIHFLESIRVRTFLLSALDDPFLPAEILNRVRAIVATNPAIDLEVTACGGHVGFVGGSTPWRATYYAECRAFQFFDEVMERGSSIGYD
jgi:uncharacterized protein